MLFITEESELIINNIVALYFYASWMPYHNKMLTMLDKMENKHKNISFYSIDVDYFKNLCKRFNVTSIPEIIILIDGKEIKRINGLVLTSALSKVFSDISNYSSKNGEKI